MCFLQVFDGANSEARLLGTYCGTSAPKKVRSTSNVLLVTFFSDGTINGNGFNISFSQTGGMLWFHKSIKKKSPCNEDPLTPHFYIVKLGFTGVYIVFLFLL